MAVTFSRIALSIPNSTPQFPGRTFYIPFRMKDVPDSLGSITGATLVSRNQALASLKIDAQDAAIVGMDTEYINQSKLAVAVLQLAFKNGNAYVIELGPLTTLPPVIVDILISKTIVKAGVNIDNDATRLAKQYPRQISAVGPLLRLDQLEASRHQEKGSKDMKCSLQYLTKKYLDIELGKDITVTISNWEAPILSIDQICYAANDALASYGLAVAMDTNNIKSNSVAQVPSITVIVDVVEPSPPQKKQLLPTTKCICVATTKKGAPCMQAAIEGSLYCYFHKRAVKKAAKKAAKAAGNSVVAQGFPMLTQRCIIEDKMRCDLCKKAAVGDSCYCCGHLISVQKIERNKRQNRLCAGLTKKGNACHVKSEMGSNLCPHHADKAKKHSMKRV